MCPERARDNSAPHDLLVIIPAWNEEESVGGVVQSVRECVPRADVLVVSDGSRDGTAAAARKAGADVLDLKINLGVGGAMRAGFVYAVDNGYRTAVQVDADGQHDHMRDSVIPTFLHFNIPLLIAGWIAAMVL